MENQTNTNQKPILTFDHELRQELISRYKQRLKVLWSNPNPYHQNPLFERTEILSKISQLEKINNVASK